MPNEYDWKVAIRIDRPDVQDGYALKLEGKLEAEPGVDLEHTVLERAQEQLVDRRPPRIHDRPPASIAEAATEETPEDAARRLAGELQRERDRADKAEERAANHARRIDCLETEAKVLVESLTSEGFPLPWWLTAARALDNLDALAVGGVSVGDITPTA